MVGIGRKGAAEEKKAGRARQPTTWSSVLSHVSLLYCASLLDTWSCALVPCLGHIVVDLVRGLPAPVLPPTTWPSALGHVAALFNHAPLLGRVRLRPCLAVHPWDRAPGLPGLQTRAGGNVNRTMSTGACGTPELTAVVLLLTTFCYHMRI